MDKSDDPNSSSWVFVYDNVKPVAANLSNTFHLDCSREPIQELTEQDLSLPGSDIESDKGTDTSDGISVISESESLFQENICTYSDCLRIDNIHDTQIVENRIACTNRLCVHPVEEHTEEWEWKKLLTPLNIISAGVVVYAVLVTMFSSVKMLNNDTQKTPDTSVLKNFDEIFDKTLSCACGETRRDRTEIESIKQCVYNRLNAHDNMVDKNKNIPNEDKKPMTTSLHDNVLNTNNAELNKEADLHNFENINSLKYNKATHDKWEKQQKQFKYKKDEHKISGEWYSNRHKHRADLREKRNKGNMSHWYFQRVNLRQQARKRNHKNHGH